MDNIRCLKCGEADGFVLVFEVLPKDVSPKDVCAFFSKERCSSALKYYIPRLA